MKATFPSGWKLLPLAEVAELRGGGTPSRSVERYFGGDIPWVTPTDLQPIGEVTELGEVNETLSEEGLGNSSAKLLPIGSVLYSSRASIGKIAVTNRVCATNQGFANFIPKASVTDVWFLAYYLCHATPQILKLAGETTYKEISRGKLKEFLIGLPQLEEQSRIVSRIKDCLSRVDEIKRLREEARREADAIFTAVLAGVIDTRWPLKPLGLLSVEIRNGWSGKEIADGVSARVLRLSCVHSRTIDPSESKEVKLREAERTDFRVKEGDLFIVRGNGSKHLVGRSAMAAESYDDIIFSDLLIRVRFGAEVLPKFVHYALHSPFLRQQIEERAKTAAGIWKINQTHLNGLQIPCPDIAQQQKVVEKIEEAAVVCQQLMAEINSKETVLISQAILRKAFAGEL